jgi:hypothetical protein
MGSCRWSIATGRGLHELELYSVFCWLPQNLVMHVEIVRVDILTWDSHVETVVHPAQLEIAWEIVFGHATSIQPGRAECKGYTCRVK